MHAAAPSEPVSGTDRPAGFSRREFLVGSSALLLGLAGAGCQGLRGEHDAEIIDIHQHVGYSGRSDAALLAHQHTMGVTHTILLPAGRPVKNAATHDGVSNGLQAKCLGNEACYCLAKANRHYYFGANEVPGLPETREEIEKYLKRGAVVLAEQKFGVECDAPAMQELYRIAADYRVPILLHWQHKMYTYGFDRFHRMLEQFPKTVFINHAQTWWANIDRNHTDQSILYPKGKVTAGGLTDRYLADYANCYGDLSAGSGLNALTRDEEFTRGFLDRHQTKLLFGSDCSDPVGSGSACQGAQTIAVVRRLAPNHRAERKILCENARRLFRL